MKKYTCIALGVAMVFTNFTSSVNAGFQSHVVCGFSLEHETTGTTGSNTTGTGTTGTINNRTTTPSSNSSDFPTGYVDPTTIVGTVGECPDPGYGGGSVALALFGGIFLGMIITVGTLAIIVWQVAGSSLGDAIRDAAEEADKIPLTPLYESPIGDYGKFELEPTYYPESDAAGLRFKFTF